ncbi:hypothetical protein FK529_04075 [Tsukamurella asaccharolytica]|uniref:Uncharacterized protein n=1 Tax=Tsukamurella asaccharolytica TaxID=2592067 RepID=A0A5C5REL3_9ACTN|nr:hypothetical protein [Tsukamurella asaccharolytica]TWS20531.1 hypothetical protein FK529_04075 [Tsukamurella asaccharolytica]
MLEPHGPLPPEIYWRRRVLAAVVALFAVVVVVLLIVFVGGGNDSSQNAATASSTTPVTTSGLPPSQAPSGDPSAANNSGGGAGGAGGSGAPQSGANASGASGAASASASPSGGGVPTPGAVVAGGPCPDANISVVVGADKATYTLGEQPTFEATITNAGPVPCARDVGTGQQQLIVLTLDGSKQLWTNFDCTFQPGIKNEVLQPGQQLRYKLQWAGTTSAPGCQAQRAPVAPGAYQVVAQLGAKRSAPVTFNIVRAAPAPEGGAAPETGTGN